MENNSSVLDSDIVKVDKYEPHKNANGKNEVTFFVASDKVDLADLQRYRIQAQTECLIAITTTNKDYDCLKFADNVILCSPNEVPLVMQASRLPWIFQKSMRKWQPCQNVIMGHPRRLLWSIERLQMTTSPIHLWLSNILVIVVSIIFQL